MHNLRQYSIRLCKSYAMASLNGDDLKSIESGGQLQEDKKQLEMESTNQQVEQQRNTCYKLCRKYRKLSIFLIVIVGIIVIIIIAVVIIVSVVKAVDQTKN